LLMNPLMLDIQLAGYHRAHIWPLDKERFLAEIG
jgi:hypothetical protein